MPILDTIAIIFDFDDTLANDTTELFLKEIMGMGQEQIDKF